MLGHTDQPSSLLQSDNHQSQLLAVTPQSVNKTKEKAIICSNEQRFTAASWATKAQEKSMVQKAFMDLTPSLGGMRIILLFPLSLQVPHGNLKIKLQGAATSMYGTKRVSKCTSSQSVLPKERGPAFVSDEKTWEDNEETVRSFLFKMGFVTAVQKWPLSHRRPE